MINKTKTYIGILFLSIMLISCSRKTASGLFLTKIYFINGWGGINDYKFDSKKGIFKYEHGTGEWGLNERSSGKYRRAKNNLILTSDTNVLSLPFEVKKIEKRNGDSISLHINFSCDSSRCLGDFYHFYIEVNGVWYILLKDTLIYEIANNVDSVRFQILLQVVNSQGQTMQGVYNKIMYSRYINLDKKYDYVIRHDYDFKLTNYRTFNNDTIKIINRNKIFLPKDSVYYYKDNFWNRIRWRNQGNK